MNTTSGSFNNIVIVLLVLLVLYVVYRYVVAPVEGIATPPEVVSEDASLRKDEPGAGETKSEVIYTQDYYPWWRSTRWWNYDGWLYQKPYYNYWRRPYYYNYWYSGRPLIIGGKRYYRRNYW